MENHLVSVIIPVHNAAGTLEAAVRSVLSQTCAELELILVDDGGSDGSPSLCTSLAKEDPRIRVYHMADRGVSAARNLGLDEARGDRITFLDADDVLHPEMLRVLSDLLDGSGADYAGCAFEKRREEEIPFGGGTSAHVAGQPERIFSGPGQPENDIPENGSGGHRDAGKAAAGDGKEEGSAAGFGESGSRQKGRGMITELCGAEILREGLLSPRHPDTRVWSKLYRAERINGAVRVRFTEGLTIGEDLLFLASLVQRDTRYVQTDRALYSYYINPRGAMERPFVPEHMDHLRCWDLAEETIRERFPEIPEDPDCRARLGAQRLIAAVLTASKIARLPSGQQAEYGKEFDLCRENIRHYRRVTGIARYLPRGYALKSFLLAHTPGLYLRLYR